MKTLIKALVVAAVVAGAASPALAGGNKDNGKSFQDMSQRDHKDNKFDGKDRDWKDGWDKDRDRECLNFCVRGGLLNSSLRAVL